MSARDRRGKGYDRVGHPDTTHPADLLDHLRHHHRLGPLANAELLDRAVLELAHAQRHGGWGVGADHEPTAHDYEDKGFA
jgi:hypothetical protein